MVQRLFKTTAFIFTMLAGAAAQGQYINAFAGTALMAGYSGDGGPAMHAILFSPTDLTIDLWGNIYFTDFVDNVVRKIDTLGIITTVAGNGFGAGAIGAGNYTGDGGQATNAELNGPVAVTTDAVGNLYFTDNLNHVVRKVNAAGIISTIAGNHLATGYAGDGGPATDALLDNPDGLVADMQRNIYVADGSNHVVRKIDTAGIITLVAGNHVPGYAGDGGPPTAANLNQPTGLAFDTSGSLYIVDAYNNVVRKIDALGVISTYAGCGTEGYNGDTTPATDALLDFPQRIAFDDSNNLYISDYFNNVLRRVDGASGIINTIAGDGYGAGSNGSLGDFFGNDSIATNSFLYLPDGIAVDHAHNVIFCDRANEVIRRIGPLSPTSVSQVRTAGAGLSVYPMPAIAGNFTVNLASSITTEVQYSITDVLGAIVMEIPSTTNKPVCIKLTAQPGIYFVTATAGAERWVSKLIME